MRKIMLALVLSVMLISLVQASELVTFNGDFKNGTTLYSNPYHLVNQSFYGKDAYPIRDSSQNQRVKVCETIYKNKIKISCTWYPGPRRNCTRIPYVEETQKCKWIRLNPIKIGCMNPNGVYTNQLNLMNFEYSYNNNTWHNVPYPRNEIFVNDSSVIFRVNIPSVCSPNYTINSAIYIN